MLLRPFNTLRGRSSRGASALAEAGGAGTTDFLPLDDAGLDISTSAKERGGLEATTCAKERGGLEAVSEGNTPLETGGGTSEG